MRDRDAILDAAARATLRLAETQRWPELTLAEIAAEAGVRLADLHGIAGKAKLIDAVFDLFDRAMSAEAVRADDPARDRLFDVIMLRMEAMQAHRAGVLALLDHMRHQPDGRLKLARLRTRSGEWALACAGLDASETMPVSVKALALAWVIGRTDRAWRRDGGEDLNATMAALDKALRSIEDRMAMILRMMGRGRKRKSDEGADTGEPGPVDPPHPEPAG